MNPGDKKKAAINAGVRSRVTRRRAGKAEATDTVPPPVSIDPTAAYFSGRSCNIRNGMSPNS